MKRVLVLLAIAVALVSTSQAAVLIEEAFATAAIEGEKLDRQAIKSSVARRLGLPATGLPPAERDCCCTTLQKITESHHKSMNSERG